MMDRDCSPTDRSQTCLHVSQTRLFWLKCAVLTGLVLLVFGPSIGYEFVNWDDPWYVTNNPLIQAWSLENLSGIATQTVTRNYAPVTIFSYLLDYTAWGEWAGGYHLTNLLWHAVNACLVYLLVKRLSGQEHWAWLTALLFAVHPVQLESVVWVSARKGLISATFILLSLFYWLRPNRTAKHELLGTLLFVVALLSKAVAVVVPGVVFVYDWLICKKSLAEAFSRQVIGLLIAIWFTLLTAGAQNTIGGGLRHHFGMSKLELLGLDAVLLWQYLGLLAYPFPLSILYDPPVEAYSVWMLPAGLFWLAFGLGAWSLRHRYPRVVFALACSLAPLVPVLNLFPITTLINDRYLYLPCIPLFVLAVAGVDWSLNWLVSCWGRLSQAGSRKATRMLLHGSGVVVVIACIGGTQWQLPHWRNDLALWSQASRVSPNLPVVQYQLALALWNEGEQQAALERIDLALTLERVDEYDRERFQRKRAEFQQQLSEQSALLPVRQARSLQQLPDGYPRADAMLLDWQTGVSSL